MFDYSELDLKNKLVKLGIKKGDIVFCHSNIGFFGKMKNCKNKDQLCKTFFKIIFKIIGTKGTLIVPTFTYSFFKKEKYNLNSASSMGIFSEWVRKKKSALRTNDPNFSVSIIGNKKIFFSKTCNNNTYDKNSFFGKFHKLNGKILNFNFPGSTILHYYEKIIGVNYRFEKKFKGTSIGNKEETWTVYSRYLRNKNSIHNPFKLMDKLRVDKKKCFVTLGKGEIFAIQSVVLFNFVKKFLKKDKNFLIS